MILLIDNYDSFTYNLAQAIRTLGHDCQVSRHDAITLNQIERLAPSHIIISPGPKTPKEAGISVRAVKKFAGKIPILGVCLGHQCIAVAFGGRIVRAPRLMHGKTSPIHHDSLGVYRDLPNPFTAMRYHSLIVDAERIPEGFIATAWTPEKELMGLRHRDWPLEGVQFHPESYRTDAGPTLLKNFLTRSGPISPGLHIPEKQS